jgi:FtsZ-binding cell division protein ZapB
MDKLKAAIASLAKEKQEVEARMQRQHEEHRQEEARLRQENKDWRQRIAKLNADILNDPDNEKLIQDVMASLMKKSASPADDAAKALGHRIEILQLEVEGAKDEVRRLELERKDLTDDNRALRAELTQWKANQVLFELQDGA